MHSFTGDQISHLHRLGYRAYPEHCLAVADIFCVPGYGEGFGDVVMEVVVRAVAAVGTYIAGLRDAIYDGETGLLGVPKNVGALIVALVRLFDDKLRGALGNNAQRRAPCLFDGRQINAQVLQE